MRLAHKMELCLMIEFKPEQMTMKIRVKVFAWLLMVAFASLFSKETASRMLRGYGLERQERLDGLLKRKSK